MSTTRAYVPGGRARNSYSPAEFVVASRCNPCWALLRVTLAPTMTAPDLSLTDPCSEVVPVCAEARDVTTRTTKNPKRKFNLREDQSMTAPFPLTCLIWNTARGDALSKARKECGTRAANFSGQIGLGNRLHPTQSKAIHCWHSF